MKEIVISAFFEFQWALSRHLFQSKNEFFALSHESRDKHLFSTVELKRN